MCYSYKSQVKATPRADVKGQGESKEKWWNYYDIHLSVSEWGRRNVWSHEFNNVLFKASIV